MTFFSGLSLLLMLLLDASFWTFGYARMEASNGGPAWGEIHD